MPKYSQYDVPNSENMVNLGVGQPSTSELPLEWFKKTLHNLSISLETPECLQYGSIPGYDSLREKLAEWLTQKYYSNIKRNLKVDHLINKDQIFMTNGNTGALGLIMSTIMETGDEIIIEDPTYFIAKNIFEEYGLNVNPIKIEDDGINIELLETTILQIMDNDKKDLQNKIFLYTIPIHHNPTSITLSHTKRLRLAKLCQKYPKFYIIADEVYHFLSFNENESYYPLADYHHKIISLGSFSKLVSPGLRVGWMYQNVGKEKSIIESIKKSGSLDSSGGLNPISFMLIESALLDGSLNKIIQNNIVSLKTKCQNMIEYLQPQLDDKELNDIKIIIPKGGYFMWLELGIDGTKFLDFAIQYKVRFHPGIKFGDSCSKFIRLSFSYYDVDDLITGMSRLIEAYKMFKKIKISICGVSGKLGSLIKTNIELNNDFLFFDNIKRNIKVNPITNIIIDVSSDNGTSNLISYLIENKINKPIIVGTTGLSSRTIDLLRIYSITNPVAIISNFSEGITKMKKMVNELNSLDSSWKFSMIEKHHINKKDSPSGTAKTLKNEMTRNCPIESIREDNIIGYHQIKLESTNEEIIISHNAKSRNIFADGCIKFLPQFLKKPAGLYYNFDTVQNDFKIYKSLGDTFMITIKNTYLEYFIKEDKLTDYLIILNLKDGNYDWTIYDKTGMAADMNGNDLLVVSKFLDDFYNIKEGRVNECDHIFKYENNKYYFQTIQPNEYTIKEDYSNNLSQLINQLTGLNMTGISKYVISNKHLIIEIKEDLFEFDTEIISTISSIINGDGDNEELYNISFINILGNEIIRAKYYDLSKGKETNGNAYACVAIFDYFATINDLSYDNPLDITILLNDDIVRIFYKNDKYFVSYKPVLL